MDIKCRRTCCAFNKGQTCFAPKVDITKKTICQSFEKQKSEEKEELDYSKQMFEIIPNYANSRHIKTLVLDCCANQCLFNKKGKCMANGITVIDQNSNSVCATFLSDFDIEK